MCVLLCKQVEADWNSFGNWYPGVITDSVEASPAAASGDGSPASGGAKTYTVKYDDDSVELGVPAALIRPARGGGGALIAEGGAGGRAKGRSYEAPAYEAWGAYVGLDGMEIADEESTTATLQEGRRPAAASSRRETPGAREEARASRRERRGRSMAGSSAGPGGRRPSSHERERRSSETRVAAASSRPIRSAEFAFEQRHGRSGGGDGSGRRGSRRSGSEIGPRRGGAAREGEVAAAARPRAASAELAQTTSLPTVMERSGGSED
jgi:hypothetical protein